MLAITSYPALDVLIGLAFFYFLLSIVASAVNEGIATAFNLRAKTLEAGIRQLLGDKEAADKFFENWRVQALYKPKRFLGKVFRDKRPSYIPSRTFALTVLDTFAPADGKGKGDLLAEAGKIVDKAPDSRVKSMVGDAIVEAQADVDKLRQSLERQFDESMQRASGWYKRRVQLFLFFIGLVLVGLINADSYTIGQRLWKDDVLRAAVVQQADKTVSNTGADCTQAENGNTPTPAQKAGDCLDQVRQLNLPLGWTKQTSPSGFFDGLAKFLGLLITVFALQLGAPFWFDTLSKLAQLRGTGRASSDPGTSDGATPGPGTQPA